MAIEKLITDHLDLWTAAVRPKSSAGRCSNSKLELIGIKKLRELILELAVRGKLAPQDPSDEPASVLLERITAGKLRLVKEGKIKKAKSLPEIGEEEKLFELPEGWEWARLTDVYDVRDGTHDTPRYCEQGYPLITSKNISSGVLDFSDVKYISEDDHKKISERSAVEKNDILFAMIGSIGNPVLVNTKREFSIKNVALFKYYLSELSSPSFLLLFLQFAENIFRKEASGAVQSFVSLGNIRSFVMALPPLHEQFRIVAKVDELMALCDQLDQRSESQLAAHQTLVETLLATLTDSSDADELAQNWARLSTHFDTLFTTEASIDALKQTILQLAVMGKLVPQDPSDEPASALLERITAEKAQLVKEKKIKKEKPLPAISEDEMPFKLPTSWRWSRVAELGEIKLGRQRSPKNHNGEHMTPYLRVANVYEGYIDVSDVKEMNFTPTEQEIFRLQAGDILLNEGQSLELVGRASIYNGEVPGACFQNTLLRYRTSNLITPEYALLYFHYCLHSGRFQKASTQTTNIAHLSAYRLAPIEFPLPPIAEQHKIVSKVKALLIFCDQLKSCLQTSQQTQLALAESLAEGALA
ncbi:MULTISPECIES: restriction endonuclease subunit S [Aeromonas]|uniref:restriction endonuclease subunit S n=1 Tax=Aeromonas TaxID=642 RepID=UPI00225551B0|nr:restriction endonuclease subunit S [Aeromonas veronii]MCX4045969.1 restriction endonuclease subunit S [Aeromonas veronii]HDX8362133.1 restriction endonuclease subunit S [Aeromonas veronii]